MDADTARALLTFHTSSGVPMHPATYAEAVAAQGVRSWPEPLRVPFADWSRDWRAGL